MTRVLIVDTELAGLDLACRCADHDNEVMLFQQTAHPIGKDFPGVKRTDDFAAAMRWVGKDGLVVPTGNAKWVRELDRYWEYGFSIFGPTVMSAALEIDRGKGMEAMKAAGIDLPHYECFDSLEAAEAFARKANQAYVFKPLGSEDDKSLTYVSESPADMVGWIQRQRERGAKTSKCMLQEKVDMLAELGVSGWFGSEGFLPGKWQACFEHKKLMNGELGPNCFTPDAEVLTSEGWKFWPEVTADDDICTLRDGRIEYEKPSQVVVGEFDGDLIGWQSPYLDILVTPGHNMYVQDDHRRKSFWFEPAAKTIDERRVVMRAGGHWYGESMPLAGEKESAAFLGAYLADGSTHRGEVIFGNCPPHKRGPFREIIAAAGFGVKERGPDLVISASELAKSLRNYGKAVDKYVPDYIKDAVPEVIESFLDAYAIGDGSTRGSLVITTVSRRMADDLQELCLKVGWAAQIRMRDRRGESHFVKGYECINRHVSYDIGISKTRLKAEIFPEIAYREPYKGKVYCVTVSSHIIYVRRNGRPCWIGQTGEMGTLCQYAETDKLAEEMLVPMAPILQALGHRGDFAIGCGIDQSGKAWPFEFTCRAGWPARYIQDASHKGDPAKWMMDLLNGEDSLKVDYRPAIGVVLAQPPWPQFNGKPECVEGVPITGMDDVWDQVHPAMMMIGRGPNMDGNRVKDGPQYQTAGEMVAVVTGLGATVSKAREACYGAISEVHYSDKIYRTDIGEKVEKALPKLHRFGYVSGLEY